MGSVDSCIKVAVICTIKVGRVEATTFYQINESTMDINNRADKIVLGSNCITVHYFERSVDVSGWDASVGSVKCSTISVAIPYDHTISGNVYMLVYYQAIHFPRLASYLICMMQSWMAVVRINDLPKFLAEDTDEKTYTIIINDPLNPNEPLIIPLVLKGVTSYFLYRKPRASYYKDYSIPHIDKDKQGAGLGTF